MKVLQSAGQLLTGAGRRKMKRKVLRGALNLTNEAGKQLRKGRVASDPMEGVLPLRNVVGYPKKPREGSFWGLARKAMSGDMPTEKAPVGAARVRELRNYVTALNKMKANQPEVQHKVFDPRPGREPKTLAGQRRDIMYGVLGPGSNSVGTGFMPKAMRNLHRRIVTGDTKAQANNPSISYRRGEPLETIAHELGHSVPRRGRVRTALGDLAYNGALGKRMKRKGQLGEEMRAWRNAQGILRKAGALHGKRLTAQSRAALNTYKAQNPRERT